MASIYRDVYDLLPGCVHYVFDRDKRKLTTLHLQSTNYAPLLLDFGIHSSFYHPDAFCSAHREQYALRTQHGQRNQVFTPKHCCGSSSL